MERSSSLIRKIIKDAESVISSEHSDNSESENDTQVQLGRPLDVKIVYYNKKKDKYKLKRPFSNRWLLKFDWITEKDGRSFCKMCKKTLTNLLPHLQRHDKSAIHLKNCTLKNNDHQFYSRVFNELSYEEEPTSNVLKTNVKATEIMLIKFCIRHNLPLSLMNFLPNLLMKCCPDSKIPPLITMNEKKAMQLIEEALDGEEFKNTII